MAKALGNFGGIYYDPFYGGLKTDLARKQAQGMLTSGAYPMSPEEYAAANYGITKGEQEARAQQAQYELQKKQMFLSAAQASQQNATAQKALQGNPIVGATNILGGIATLPKAITDWGKLLGVTGTTAQPQQPTNYPYTSYAPQTTYPYAEYPGAEYGIPDYNAPYVEGQYNYDFSNIDLSSYFYTDFSNLLGSDTSSWLDFGV